VEKVADEIRTLRRTMRDLVALSALPAVWVGYQPREVAEGLADALLSTLRLELVYLRVPGQTNVEEIEVARTAGGSPPSDQTRDIGRALAPWLDGAVIDPAPTIPNPVGPGTVRVFVVIIGCGQPAGVLVAGSRRAAFPSEEDRSFLTVGANQAAAVLQRLHAEVALRESEQRFRTFVDHAADAFFLIGERGTILDVNRQACESLGYTRDELLGKTPPDFDPDVTPADLKEFERSLESGSTIAFESRHRRKDGTFFPVEIRGRSFREGGRRLTVALTRDITERKRLEAELRQADARLDLAIRGSNVGIWEVDIPDGDFDKGVWNWINVWEQVGLQPLVNRGLFAPWLDLVHPDDKDRMLGTIYSYLNGETKDYEVEYRMRHKDGTYRWMLARGIAIRNAAGKPIRFVGSRVDITELKRVLEVLRESEAWFRFLANAMPQIVWTARPDGTPEYLNDRFAKYTGLPAAEVTGERWLSVVHPDDRERTMTRWMSDVANGSDHDIEFRLRAADGRYRWFKSRGLPVRDESGQIVKWVGTMTDIDDQKRAEEAERRAKEAAEAASRAKSEFLANISHEIRTPMNAILGMTELAIESTGSDEQRQYLTIVKSSADALLSVINDLLDFSKIEAGKLELDYAAFSLRGILGKTLRVLALRAHKKGLELVCQIQPDVPDALIGDAGRLRQILLNLVGNAIKFTEQGEVIVRIVAGPTGAGPEPDSPEDRSGTSQMLRFFVSDTGIGIPPDKQKKIFQAFEQADNSTTRRYGGTGLGLSIATRLVALMRGEIGVDSEPGRGSTFCFTARFGLGADQPVPPMVPPLVELQGLRVLVVDDNATNRQILDGWLRSWRTEPTVVGGGLEALDALWRASASGRPFSLVVLDARMPGVDGPALAERILQSPELSPTRIILLTSDDLRGEVARFRELGIAAYAMKPVQQEELLDIIYRVLSRPAPIEAATDGPTRPGSADDLLPFPAESAASAAGLRILLAEDNDFNQQVIAHLLRRRGHDVVVAGDGRKALEALDHCSFDLLLLDIQMPELDGFEVIEVLRRRERTAGGHLPVVALTAHAMKEDRERCLQAGMDDYLSKPIHSAELVAVIDRVLAGRPASEPPPASSPEPGALVDPDKLLAACDDDPVLLGNLIRIFQNNIPGSLARVQEAITRADPERLRESAHQLRGMVSTFSTNAAQAASRLEAMGAGGQLDDAASSFETLAKLLERLGSLLENLPIDELRRHGQRPQE
jgi:two-component system, sensor histidine kinase and response regulator